MSKKTNIALLTLAAFLFLGFSIAANAGKPPPADSAQVLTSGPLNGDNHTCSVVWLDDQPSGDVDVTIWFDQNYVILYLQALGFRETGAFTNTNRAIAYCTVEWTGQASDLKATWCAVDDYYGISGCVELH